ncbi:transposase [Lactimicrobium massiliense]|uniref:transposase n=1 Tax=Lactimicrobium massiliense TaxID=2161814 RepID=UPI000D553250
MDAGYFGENTIRTLYEHKVSFISRLKENFKLYKDLTAKYLPSIEKEEDLVEYNGRYAYIKRVQCKLVDDHMGVRICLPGH